MQNQILEGFRLSPQQKHLWLLQDFGPDSPYRAQCAVRVEAAPDAARLRAAVLAVVERHEVLRTTFRSLPEMLTPLQVAAGAGASWLPAQDWTRLPAAEQESRAEALLAELRRAPLDLERGPFLHAAFAQTAAGEGVLFLSLPALCADAATLKNFVRELAREFAPAAGGEEAEAPLQYVVASEWLNDLLESDDAEAGRAYWRKLALSASSEVELPFESRAGADAAFEPRSLASSLDAETVARLEALARRHETSAAEFLLACWQALLWRLSGQGEIVVGTAFNGRTDEELERVLGPLTKYLPVRCELKPGARLPDLLAQVRQSFSDAFVWQECFAWEQLAERGEGVLARPFHPLCFDFEEHVSEQAEGGPRFSTRRLYAHADRFKLKLSCARRAGSLDAEFHYDAAAFAAEDVRALSARFTTFLRNLLRNPQAPLDDVEFMSDEELRTVLRDFNDTRVEFADGDCLHHLFEHRARLSPDATAISSDDGPLSFSQLDALSSRLSTRLRALGAGPDAVVGLCLERSPALVVSALAALKAGAAYLPLDPSYPQERLRFMLEDSKAPLLITSRALAGLAGEAEARTVFVDAQGRPEGEEGAVDAVEAAGVQPDNLAYVIYTSGSTGEPKGAMVTHRAIVNHMRWMLAQFPLAPSDAVLQKTPLSFDASVWELFAPLLAGARLVLARPGGHADSAYLGEVVRGESVTTLQVVPTLLRALVEGGHLRGCGTLRRLFCGGEPLSTELAAAAAGALPAGAEVVNLYGPTECAVEAAWWAWREGAERVAVGRPIWNARLYVLDGGGRPVPAGAWGEVYIGGECVGRGYVGKPSLTAERYVPDPYSGEAGGRMYRTGDVGRWMAGGELEVSGRVDGQVKVRGHRIELGEVEARLSAHADVREAVARVIEGDDGQNRIAAYLVAREGATPTVEELRRHLLESLPEYMLPSWFVTLEALPLLPNGKVDRRALPAPGSERPELEGGYLAPRYDVEEVLAAVWAQVLGIERVGIRDNFFALGGDSIRSVRVVSLAKERGIDCTVQQLFEHQTIQELARSVGEGEARAGGAVRTEPFAMLSEEDRRKLPEDVEDAFPLTMLQQGMLYHMKLTPDTPIYHNVSSWHLRARLEPEALSEAVQRVVARHPNLRTSFHAEGFAEALQLVHRQATLPVGFDDLRHLAPPEQEQAVSAYVKAESRRPFDFTRPPLLRLHIHRRGEETFQLTLTEFHPIFDGWSLTSTLAEIFNNYFALLDHGALPQEKPPTANYRDYVYAERLVLESEECLRFWDEKLGDCTPLALPRWPSLVGRGGARMHHKSFQLTGALLEGLTRLGREAAVPLKDVLLAAHVKVMGMVSGRADVLTGLSANNTRPEDVDGDDIRGLFINTVPLRLRLGGGSWADLARQTFEAERELLPYRLYPMAMLQKKYGGRRKLLETSFNYVHFHSIKDLFESGRVEVVGPGDAVELSSFTLQVNFSLNPTKALLKMVLSCDASQVYEGQAAAIADCYLQVLRAMAADPHAAHEDLQPPATVAGGEPPAGPPAGADDFESSFLF